MPGMSSFKDPTSRLVEHLSSTSTPYIDPLARIPWDRLSRRANWLPEAAVSLNGWAEYMNLPEDQRRMLSRYEFLSVLLAVQRFESVFMERVSGALRGQVNSATAMKYRMHMVREHAGHALVLMELLRGGGVQRLRRGHSAWLTRLITRHADLDGLLFWVAIYIGEEIHNRMFRWLRKHHAGACPVMDELIRTYLVDAARHLSHAHEMLENALTGVSSFKLRLLRPVVQRVYDEIVRDVFYPHRSVYEASGLYPGEYWARIARSNPHRERFIQQLIGTTLRPFRKRGMNIK
jgi:hypothetical protein